jgi:hypothetical protein
VKLRLIAIVLGQLGLVAMLLLYMVERSARERRDEPLAESAVETQPAAPELEPETSASRVAVSPQGETRSETAETTPIARRTARLFGTITEADDGRPIAGLDLVVLGQDEVHQTRTAEDGSFAFELAAGAWTFVLRAPPGRVPFAQELGLAAEEERELSHALGSARGLCVRVWCVEFGNLVPCGGASAWLVQGESAALARLAWPRSAGLHAVRTDADGEARLPFADFERYVLSIVKEGFLAWSASFDFSPFRSSQPFSPDGCIHLVLESAELEVHGQVLDPEGQPLGGVLVGMIDRERRVDDLRALGAVPPEAAEVVAQASEIPGHAFTSADGRFRLALPRRLAERAVAPGLVACPGRATLVHHVSQELGAAELFGQREVIVRLPRAGEVELEFVDEAGVPRDGVASVRDADGIGHGGDNAFTWSDLAAEGAGRRLLTSEGRVRLRHPGGRVRIGLSPAGVWDGREQELVIPPGEELRQVRIVVPR